MTIDEAISHALEVAEALEKKANTYGIKQAYIPKSREPVDCISCAAEHRQLAEWLKEFKEAKRLLKAAIDEWNMVCEWAECGKYCGWFKDGKCMQEWSKKEEALKLIGEDETDG